MACLRTSEGWCFFGQSEVDLSPCFFRGGFLEGLSARKLKIIHLLKNHNHGPRTLKKKGVVGGLCLYEVSGIGSPKHHHCLEISADS